MAESEERDAESKESPEPKKGGFLKEWRKLAGWQKAGVLIGGGALVVAILIYINRQPAPTLTGNAALPNNTGNQPGAGDQFPPLPVPPPTPTPLPPGVPPPGGGPFPPPGPGTPPGGGPFPGGGTPPPPPSPSVPAQVAQPAPSNLAANVAQIYHRPAGAVQNQNTHLQSAINELYGRSHPAPLHLHPAQRRGFVPFSVPHAGTRPAGLSAQILQMRRGTFF